jgi:1-acyl-sn-glycerol-3-phosphate acyltransferase
MTPDANHHGALPDPNHRNLVWLGSQLLAQMIFPVWFRVRARGVEHIPKGGGALLVINHQSFLDPLIVGMPLSRPVSYVARDTLFDVPIVGWMLRHTYVFPVNREAASTSSIREALRRLKHGFLLGIFPEGTRGDGRTIQELKPGFVSLVRRSGLPVIPVAVAGTSAAFPRDSALPLPRRVYVVYGDPIPVEQLQPLCGPGHEEEMIGLVRRRMMECFDEAEAWRRRGD